MTHDADQPLLTSKQLENETVVHFATPQLHFTTGNLPAIREGLLGLVEGTGPANVTLNMSNVRFLDSHVLAIFLSLFKRVRARGGRLRVSAANPEIYELFLVTGLTMVFDVDAPGKEPAA